MDKQINIYIYIYTYIMYIYIYIYTYKYIHVYMYMYIRASMLPKAGPWQRDATSTLLNNDNYNNPFDKYYYYI